MAVNKARLTTRVVFVVSVFVVVPAFAHRGWDGYHLGRRPPSEVMVDVINNLGLALLEVHNEHNENNIAISPYGAASVLVAVLEGVVGETAEEIRHSVDLPQDLSLIRVGLRDIHRHLKSYFIPKEGFLAGLTLSHENISLNREYESILRFYGYDIESFNVPIYPLGTAKPFEEGTTTEEPISTLKSMQTTNEKNPETTPISSTDSTTVVKTTSTANSLGTTEYIKTTTEFGTTNNDETTTKTPETTMNVQGTTSSESISTIKSDITTNMVITTLENDSTTTNMPTTNIITSTITTTAETTTTAPSTATSKIITKTDTTEANVASTEKLDTSEPESTTRLDTTLEMSTLRTRQTTLGSDEVFEKAETMYASTITEIALVTTFAASEQSTAPSNTLISTLSTNDLTTESTSATTTMNSQTTSLLSTLLQSTQNILTESTSTASQSNTQTTKIVDSTTSPMSTLTSTTPLTSTETTTLQSITDATLISTQSTTDAISTLAEELESGNKSFDVDSNESESELLEVREIPGLGLVAESLKDISTVSRDDESTVSIEAKTEIFGATITVGGHQFFDISSEDNNIGTTGSSNKEISIEAKSGTVNYEDLKNEARSTRADFENTIESSDLTTISPTSTTLVSPTTNNFNTGSTLDIESMTTNDVLSTVTLNFEEANTILPDTENTFAILNSTAYVTSDLSDVISTTPMITSTPPVPIQSSGTTPINDFTYEVTANITKRRTARSVIDYIIARYYDTYQVNNDRKYLPHSHYPSYHPEIPYTFLVNGEFREPNISFMTYDTVLPFSYIPGLNAMAISFPLDSAMYYLLLVLPVEENGLDKLIYEFRKVTSLKEIVDNLKYTHIKALIPSFMLRGFVVLTPTLQKMGIKKIFEPRQGDFSQLTSEKDIYVTNVEQAVTVTIRNYLEHPHANSRTLQEFRPVEFRADHPFLYFVMDSQIHVNLMAGKIVNPLNSRIR